MNDNRRIRGPFRRLIEQNNGKHGQTADEIGLSRPFFSQVVSGQKRMSLKSCLLVSRKTGIPVAALVRAYGTNDAQRVVKLATSAA